MKKFLKYDKRIYLMWLIAFIMGMEIFGVIIIPFLSDWGGLNQFQIQTLQSWFMVAIFLFEVPTGLIGDTKGKKYSMLWAYTFFFLGPLVYTIYPSFGVFMLGELFFALGVAFTSGAWESLMYDITVETGVEKEYGKIWLTLSNLHLVALIISGFIGAYLVNFMTLDNIFRMASIRAIISLILVSFIKEPVVSKKTKLAPNYKLIFKKAVNNIRNNPSLKRLTRFSVIVYVVSYFSLWFFPSKLLSLSVSSTSFGWYRFAMILSEIVFSALIARILSKTKKKRIILFIVISLSSVGFALSGLVNTAWAVAVMMVLSGGIGLRFREIMSPYFNRHISSKERATTLSFISMLRTLSIAVMNPIMGLLVDFSFPLALVILSLIILSAAVFFLPKEDDFLATK